MTQTPKVFSYARFSSPEQAKGHSLERQVQRAREWAEERGLILVDEISDLGLSAYHADHLKTGALGRFVALVEAGKIPEGSILLVEQLDRLTRDSLHNAQGLLWRILDAGIEVVTLVDGEKYTKKQGIGGVIKMLVTLESGHQESDKKADRVRASWHRRHAAAMRGEIITRNLPGWLKVEGEKIVPIKDRAEAVKLIFALAADGLGCTAIANRLNERKISPWKKAATWRKVSVHKVLRSPSVTGILVLKMASGTEEVHGYYPQLIDDATFAKVQRSLTDRTISPGSPIPRVGRTGGYRNLFSGFAFCSECGARMAITDAKSRGSMRFRYKLICDSARLKRGCVYHSIHYQPVEDAILQYCTEVDLTVLTAKDDNKPEVEAARARVQAIKDDIEAKEAQVEAEMELSSMVRTPELMKRLAERLDVLQVQTNAAKKELEDAERELTRLNQAGNSLIERVATIRQLAGDPESVRQHIETRRKLRLALAGAIERVDFYAWGFGNRWPVIDQNGITVMPLEEATEGDDATVKAFLQELAKLETGREYAAFLVKFKNGHARLFRWSTKDQCFTQSMIRTKEFSEMASIPLRWDNETGAIIRTPWEEEVEKYVDDEDDYDQGDR